MQENGFISLIMAFMRMSFWLFLEAAPILFPVTNGSNRATKLLEFSLGDFFSLAAAIWTIFNFAAVFFNDKRRALHDYMAGSVVIKLSLAERENKSTREPGDLLDPVPE